MSPIPTFAYVEQVESLFGIRYPDSFRALCRQFGGSLIRYDVPGTGDFIGDVETLKQVNSRVGGEQWGDYEQAIAGTRHPKDGMQFWGELLPIFVMHDGPILGFAVPPDGSDRVYLWSVHTIVGDYPSLEAWLTSPVADPADPLF